MNKNKENKHTEKVTWGDTCVRVKGPKSLSIKDEEKILE